MKDVRRSPMKTKATRLQTSAPDDGLQLSLAEAAIAHGFNGPGLVPVGNHQARGVAVLAIDAWVNQAVGGERRESLRYKDILGLTLALACPTYEKLLRLMEQATAKLFREDKIDLGHVARCLDDMQAKYLEQLDKRPTKGRCLVTGAVKLIEFKPGE